MSNGAWLYLTWIVMFIAVVDYYTGRNLSQLVTCSITIVGYYIQLSFNIVRLAIVCIEMKWYSRWILFRHRKELSDDLKTILSILAK